MRYAITAVRHYCDTLLLRYAINAVRHYCDTLLLQYATTAIRYYCGALFTFFGAYFLRFFQFVSFRWFLPNRLFPLTLLLRFRWRLLSRGRFWFGVSLRRQLLSRGHFWFGVCLFGFDVFLAASPFMFYRFDWDSLLLCRLFSWALLPVTRNNEKILVQ